MAKCEIKDGVGIIPEGTTEIDCQAFLDCEELTSIEIPNTVKIIRFGAFYGCKGLTNIVIPDSVTEIRQEVFADCKALASVTIGSSVRSIDYDVFRGCDNLKQIIFRVADPALIEIERGVDLGGYQATLYVPDKKSIAAFKKKAIWKKYAGIEVYEAAGDDLSKDDKEREDADKDMKLETITTVWDELETTSGQKEVYEINDYYMERTAMLNIWYVYFSLTGSPLSPEALEKLKESDYYTKGELLVEAYNIN